MTSTCCLGGAPAQTYPGYPQPGYAAQPYPGQQPYGAPPPQYGPPQGYAPPPGSVQPYGVPMQGYSNVPPQVMQPNQPGQPGQGQVVFAPRPEAIQGIPPGLEYLTQIDQLLVHQQVELFEGKSIILLSIFCAFYHL